MYQHGRLHHSGGDKRASQERLTEQARLLDLSNDAIIVRDADDRITYWSQGAEVEYGYSLDEALGRISHELLKTEFSLPLDAINQILDRTGGWGGEIIQTRKDGTRGTYLARWLVDRDPAGRRRSVLACNTNISERKETAKAMLRGEARLRAVLETAVDAIITIDERGRIQSVNPATERMFGYASPEMVGQNVNMLMPSPYKQEHDGYLMRYLHTGEERIIGIGREVQAQRKDGTVFPVDLAVSEVEPGKIFTGMIRDISERKMAEARLREADRMASIGALAAGLGHDMNNVLLPVRAHLNVLKVKSESARDHSEHVEKIQQGVVYLQQLADGLHFLAMDPDQEDESGGVTDVAGWWEQTGALLRKAVPKHVKVTTSIPKDLPEVAVAAHALTQAVLNLIVNAGEAIPAERRRRQGYVRLTAECGAGGSVKLSITDNGTGMTEEVKRRAFDMFFTTKPRGLGTGLGLAMVRKIVDRAGGSIEVVSAPGKGTTISLLLPVASAPGADGQLVGSVSLRDGRAASLIRNLLEASGVRTGDHDVAGRNIWVMEPTPQMLVEARKWKRKTPRGRIVLFGRPEVGAAEAWDELKPVTIDDPEDLEAVRVAIGSAMSGN
jgi:PAS domain S-box-containing protein